MIEFLKFWAKGLGLAIVIVSILEMILPNNKTKKYIRMVMGVYILFSIISPFIKNEEIFKFDENDFENFTGSINSIDANQTSMDRRIEELYSQELEKDISTKLKNKGYSVTKCKVNTTIGDTKEKTKITNIRVVIDGKDENHKLKNNDDEENKIIENVLIEEIQKVKVAMNKEKENEEEIDNKEISISKEDIQNVKKFLIEEYEVSEECLEIN